MGRSIVRKASILLVGLAIVLLIAGCGESPGTTTTVAPATAAAAAPTATAEAAQATTSTEPEATTTEDAQTGYREDVKEWWDKWTPKLEEQFGALENLDPLTVTDDQIGAVGKFAEVVNDAAKAFKDIEPPASAATAHADYASMVQGMANGLERLQKALDAGELSGLIEAMGAFEVLMKDSDVTVAALEQAAGVKLVDAGTDAQTPDTTPTAAQSSAVGSKDNPVPLGTEQQVGDWAVTVTKYTPDATAAVMKANEFNDEPEAGETYVLVALSARYTGEESGTFWLDTSYKFLGKSGNTFDEPFAFAPEPISDAGETFPGASVFGNLLYQVPTDQAAGGLLIMEPSFSFDEARAFFVLQ